MINDVFFSLWFLLPAAIANMAPILSANIPMVKNWQTPVDGGRKYQGKEIFGSHKTWRGFISGILAATMVLWLQVLAVNHFSWAQSVAGGVDYNLLPILILGPLFGLGALGGDVLESFLKRQKGVQPGQAWIPFDQLDYIFGAILVSLPFVILRLELYLWIIVIWFLMHILASYVGWRLGLKERPI